MLIACAAALAAMSIAVAAEDKPAGPLRVVMLSASGEYDSDASTAAFKAYLESKYDVKCTILLGKEKGTGVEGLEALDAADLMLVFTRRVTLPDDQLARVRKYCDAGRPVVGVRTASHAFQNWLEFDRDVLGGNYKGHYGAGPKADVTLAEGAKDHPVLAGVRPFSSAYSLYRNTGLAKDVTLLASATSDGKTEPVAWTRLHNNGRVFYTSLGGPDDFKDENFRRLLVNAIFWTTGREAKEK
jgi:type 1 glutamine amidotransferase